MKISNCDKNESNEKIEEKRINGFKKKKKFVIVKKENSRRARKWGRAGPSCMILFVDG